MILLLTITLSLIWTTESLIPSYSRGLSNYQKACNRKFKNEIRLKMSINDDEGMEINDSKAEDEDENENENYYEPKDRGKDVFDETIEAMVERAERETRLEKELAKQKEREKRKAVKRKKADKEYEAYWERENAK